jgi:excisionase family DNA binding protein
VTGLPTTPTVDVPAAAELLGIHPDSLYSAIRDGESPVQVIKVGRRLRIPTAPLLKLLGIDGEVES